MTLPKLSDQAHSRSMPNGHSITSARGQEGFSHHADGAGKAYLAKAWRIIAW